MGSEGQYRPVQHPSAAAVSYIFDRVDVSTFMADDLRCFYFRFHTQSLGRTTSLKQKQKAPTEDAESVDEEEPLPVKSHIRTLDTSRPGYEVPGGGGER